MLASAIVLLALGVFQMSAAIPILIALNVSTTMIPVDLVSSTVIPMDMASSSTMFPSSSTDFTGPTRVMQVIVSSTDASTSASTEATTAVPANPDHVVSDAERTDVVILPAVKAREIQGDVQTDTATRNDSVSAANSQPRITGTAIVPAVSLPAGSIIINPPKNVQPAVQQPTMINGQPLPSSSFSANQPTSNFPVNQPLPLAPKIGPPFVVSQPIQGPVVGIPTGTQQRFF